MARNLMATAGREHWDWGERENAIPPRRLLVVFLIMGARGETPRDIAFFLWFRDINFDTFYDTAQYLRHGDLKTSAHSSW